MKRHDTDVVSLAFGLIFATVVGWWLLMRWVAVASPSPGWFIAAILLALGALGIFTTILSWRHHETDQQTRDQA